jgi:hypothetical protein
VTLTAPVGEVVRHGAGPLTVAGTVDAGSGPATLTVNGRPVAIDADGGFTTSLDLPEGDHELTVVATDAVGNATRIARRVIVDRTPPTIELRIPTPDAAGATIWLDREEMRLAGRTSPDTTRLEVSTGGRSYNADEPAGEFDFPLSLGLGPQTVTLTAVDAVGNTASVTLEVTVDTVPPVIRIAEPWDGQVVSAPRTRLAGRAQDAALAEVRVNGEPTPTTDDGRFDVMIDLSEGANEISVSAVDRAGNVAGTVIAVTFRRPPPTVEGFTWLRSEVFEAGGQRHTVQVYRNTAFAEALGLADDATDPAAEFVLIPAGAFTIGSPDDEPGRTDAEGPPTTITIRRPFLMARTEITQAVWKAGAGSRLLSDAPPSSMPPGRVRRSNRSRGSTR